MKRNEEKLNERDKVFWKIMNTTKLRVRFPGKKAKSIRDFHEKMKEGEEDERRI